MGLVPNSAPAPYLLSTFQAEDKRVMFPPQKCNFLSDYPVKRSGHSSSCGFPIHPPALLVDRPEIPYGRASRLLRQNQTSGFELADCMPFYTHVLALVIRH